jgi:N-formylglutamate deformylase
MSDLSFDLHLGRVGLLLSMPHMGSYIPSKLAPGLVPRALDCEDADWHMDRLYDFALDLGASVLRPRLSRYVIDLNRPPDDAPMYPGASNTELCPTRFFTGEPLYRTGQEPAPEEKIRRRQIYWEPYHQALQGELQRLLELHGRVLLWDAHSIRSQLPWLFEGRLPDLNIGTADGKAAHPAIAQAVVQACAVDSRFTHVLNGRFKGGYITRHYGQPDRGIHAVQLELCQCLYMQEEPPYAYLPDRARQLQPTLHQMVRAALQALGSLPR